VACLSSIPIQLSMENLMWLLESLTSVPNLLNDAPGAPYDDNAAGIRIYGASHREVHHDIVGVDYGSRPATVVADVRYSTVTEELDVPEGARGVSFETVARLSRALNRLLEESDVAAMLARQCAVAITGHRLENLTPSEFAQVLEAITDEGTRRACVRLWVRAEQELLDGLRAGLQPPAAVPAPTGRRALAFAREHA
jgi:hypothetical protein